MIRELEEFKNPPVDPRIVAQIQSSPRMSAEQGVTFMQEWGGPQIYGIMAKEPEDVRLVYYAVQKGYTTNEDIASATDLKVGRVGTIVSQLTKRGLLRAV